MKKVLDMMIRAMMFIVVAYCVKVAVVDLWECYLAVDMIDSAKRFMMVM